MKTMLKDYLNWEKLMTCSRCSGGHEDIMENLFKDGEVIASYIEDDYQGNEAYVYFLNGEYILITDYFGSCSGCDAWEDANDEEVRNLCIQLANNAHRFDSIHTLMSFLEVDVEEDKATYYAEHSTSKQILEELRKNLWALRDYNINKLEE